MRIHATFACSFSRDLLGKQQRSPSRANLSVLVYASHHSTRHTRLADAATLRFSLM